MHARLTRFAGLDPERIDETVRQSEEEALGDLEQQPGFRGITVRVNRKSGQAVAITLWETEGDMKQSEELTIKARERAVATAGPSREPARMGSTRPNLSDGPGASLCPGPPKNR
jgi:heme-degrading monooxygenase HmoA